MTEETTKCCDYKELFQSIAMVSAKIASLSPDKHNAQSNYSYISADQIYHTVGQAMAEVGLVIVPSIKEMKTETVEMVSRSGSKIRRYEVTLNMEMLLGDELGAALHFPWMGVGVDYSSPDKAFACAQTTAMTYFMKMTFLVGKGNADGVHSEVPEQLFSSDASQAVPVANYKTPPPQSRVAPPPPPPPIPRRAAPPPPPVRVGNEPAHKYDTRNMPLESLPCLTASQVADVQTALSAVSDLSEWKAWMSSNKWVSLEDIPSRAFTGVMKFLKSKAQKRVPITHEIPKPTSGIAQANTLLLKQFNKKMMIATETEVELVEELFKEWNISNPTNMTNEQLTELMEVLVNSSQG